MSTLPRSLGELTPEWLEGRLRKAGHDAKVESLVAEPLDGATGFQGNFAHVRAAYTGQTDLPSHFVVKMVPENEQLRAIGRQLSIYGREAAFYGEIGAGSGIRVPRCFGAQFDPDTGDTAIVLEDLSHLRTGNQYEGFTLSEAGRAVDQYAALHARWWNEPALSGFSWLPPWNQPEMVAYLPTVFPAAWQGCAALFAETLSDEDRALGTLLGERLADLMNHAGTGPVTLVHGDARHDNLMFLDDDAAPPHVVDWQYVASGRGVLDIAYYLTQGGPSELVAPVERDMVARYHNALCAHGVSGYDAEACWSDYCRFALYMLVFPVFTASMIDPSSAEQREALGLILARGLDAAKRLDSAELASG